MAFLGSRVDCRYRDVFLWQPGGEPTSHVRESGDLGQAEPSSVGALAHGLKLGHSTVIWESF